MKTTRRSIGTAPTRFTCAAASKAPRPVFLREHLSSAHARVARAERAGHRALARAHQEFQLRLEKTHALLSNRCRRAPVGRVGHRPPRMDTCGVWLRSEQPRLLHMCRHARATPRYSSASDTRVHLLAGHSADSRSPAACGCATGANEAQEQHCRCRRSVELVAAAAVTCGHDLS